MSACVRCARPVQDAHVCSTCSTDAAKALGNIAWLETELDLTITRQTQYAARGEMTKGSKITPVPFHVKASDARAELRNILVGWCRLYADECHADLPADTLTGMSRFLLRRTEWFRHFEAASDFVDEVTRMVSTCIHLVDSPANRTTFAVGPCPQDDEHGACVGEVRAFIPSSDDTPATMACSACGSVWQTWEWHRAGRRILARMAVDRTMRKPA